MQDYGAMTARTQSWRFWVVTVAALGMAALTFSLGQWQLGRAAQKDALYQAIERQKDKPLLDKASLAELNDPSSQAAVIHRSVRLEGHWLGTGTVYLDNRPMNGRAGFFVLTPLRLQATGQVILVQRGWIPRDFQDRSRLASVVTPAGAITLEGRIAPAPSKLYEFKNAEAGQIRQNLDLSAFAAETGLPLLQGMVIQTNLADDGLLRDWAAPNLGVEKHYGYAVQWFSLSALVTGLYLWFQIIQPLLKRRDLQSNASSRDKSKP